MEKIYIKEQEVVSPELTAEYNRRFEEILNTDTNSVGDYITKYMNNGVDEEDLEQIVILAMWESAKKEEVSGRPIEDRLKHFRSIVHFRLKDEFRKNSSDNILLGKMRRYKKAKESVNENPTKEDIINYLGITEKKYLLLMEKEKHNSYLSLDAINNDGGEEDGAVSFHDNFGCIEEGYAKVDDNRTDKEKYDDLYGEVKEAFQVVFKKDLPSHDVEKYFNTFISRKVKEETGVVVAKREGVRATAISERLKVVEKNREKILEELLRIQDKKIS